MAGWSQGTQPWVLYWTGQITISLQIAVSVNLKSGLVEMSAKLKTIEFAGKVMIKESKTKSLKKYG